MAIAEYYRPSSEEEALRLMGEGAGRGRYLAGGTDLICEDDPCDFVVDVRRLFRYIRIEKDEVILGAGTTVRDLERSADLARAEGGLLRRCAAHFASVQIRNMATVGGNLAGAVPSADLAPVLLVLDARCVIAGAKGRREVALGHFFTGPRESVLGGDLLVEVRFPVASTPATPARTSFLKIGRVAGDIAIASAAARLEMEGERCTAARIALGAVAPTPRRAVKAEAALVGGAVHDEAIEKAGRLARDAAEPITDQRGSAAYRRRVTGVLVERAIRECLAGRGEA